METPPDEAEKNHSSWSDTAADSIEDFTARTSERVASPLRRMARIFAFLPLILLFFAVFVTLLIIGGFRAIDNYLPQPTWLVHFIMGGGFILIGLTLWIKRPRLFPR